MGPITLLAQDRLVYSPSLEEPRPKKKKKTDSNLSVEQQKNSRNYLPANNPSYSTILEKLRWKTITPTRCKWRNIHWKNYKNNPIKSTHKSLNRFSVSLWRTCCSKSESGGERGTENRERDLYVWKRKERERERNVFLFYFIKIR